MHLGMGLICGAKIKDMIASGFTFTIYLADWHSWINNKMGGDLQKIRLVGEYFQHCFTALGIPPDKVHYVWASHLTQDQAYWEKVVKIAKYTSLSRVKRALPIMGRSPQTGDVETASLLYPCMQVADIFHLNVDVACAGIDQRKAHMLARDIAPHLHRPKPISLHTPLLQGLEPPSPDNTPYDEDHIINQKIKGKMSKSRPQRCIYIHDSPNDLKKKIAQAYCPPNQPDPNPILDIIRTIIFPLQNHFNLTRPPRYGGPKNYIIPRQLIHDYVHGRIHPQDLKESTASHLINILADVRNYFNEHDTPLQDVKKLETTR